MNTTIFSLASGKLPAGIAVVRLSGPRSWEILLDMGGGTPDPGHAVLRRVHDAESGIEIDRGLVLGFRKPHSFTGEDVVEFHLHGGPTVVQALFKALESYSDVRLAKAGEFTRRAFENGRLDLIQTESLSDLLSAQTEMQRRQALAGAEGDVSRKINSWRGELTSALAYLEADIDFSDEHDVSDNNSLYDFSRLVSDMRYVLDRSKMGIRIRDGFTIAVIGEPNVGKSSFINFLSGRDVAIVSDIPGTTRDLIEVSLNIGGFLLTFVDTAGLRESTDCIEKEGIRRSYDKARTADLVLHLVVDAQAAVPEYCDTKESIKIVSKTDMTGEEPGFREGFFYLSAKTGAGFSAVEKHICDWAEKRYHVGESVLLTHKRQYEGLEKAFSYLQEASTTPEIVLKSECVRQALHSLEHLIGRVEMEDVLGEIFSRFCVGK